MFAFERTEIYIFNPAVFFLVVIAYFFFFYKDDDFDEIAEKYDYQDENKK